MTGPLTNAKILNSNGLFEHDRQVMMRRGQSPSFAFPDGVDIVGLGYTLDFKASRTINEASDRHGTYDNQNLKIRGTEAPPR